MKNSYYFYRHPDLTPMPDLDDETCLPDDVPLSYWMKVLTEFDRISILENLKVYVVWGTVRPDVLPWSGKDVVVIMLMDEGFDISRYAGKVGFVFKTHGFTPFIAPTLRGKTLAEWIKFLRDGAIWAKGLTAMRLDAACDGWADRCLAVPLGYARQCERAIVPIEDRRYTLSFLGSVDQRPYPRLSVRSLIKTPKAITRTRMFSALERMETDGRYNIYSSTTPSFNASFDSDGAFYSDVMSDSKICLAPRGSSVETFRLFEGMRQGCIVICDRLPGHWFYDDCPAIQIDDWGDLGTTVDGLLSDPERRRDLHERSLLWWRDRCCETAVAATMAGHLGRHAGASAERS